MPPRARKFDIFYLIFDLRPRITDYVEEAKAVASHFILRKIFQDSKDKLGIITIDGKNQIQIISPLQIPTFDQYKILINQVNEDETNTNTSFSNWINSIQEALESINNYEHNHLIKKKNIYVFSSFLAQKSCESEIYLVTDAINKAQNLEIVLIQPDQDHTSIPNLISFFQSKLASRISLEITSLTDILAKTLYFERRAIKPSPWKICFEISPEIKISMTGYIRIRRQPPKPWKACMTKVRRYQNMKEQEERIERERIERKKLRQQPPPSSSSEDDPEHVDNDLFTNASPMMINNESTNDGQRPSTSSANNESSITVDNNLATNASRMIANNEATNDEPRPSTSSSAYASELPNNETSITGPNNVPAVPPTSSGQPSAIGDDTTELKRGFFVRTKDGKIAQNIKKEDLVPAYLYGSTKVPVPKEVSDEFAYKSGPKRMNLIGFVNEEQVANYNYVTGNGNMIFMANDRYSGRALGALSKGLQEMNLVALVRRVYRDAQCDVKIGILTPPDAAEDNNLNYLTYIELPFADEIKKLKFASLPKPTENQLTVMDNLIDTMMLEDDFDCETRINPYIQHSYNCLGLRAIKGNCHSLPSVEQHVFELIKSPQSILENLDEALLKVKEAFNL